MPDMFMDVDTALAEVPVNLMPLLDDTDFKTRETAIAYNSAGMDLVWNFVTSAGAMTQTAVTPTTAGTYDWAHQGDGIYTIEIPASGGASINNDTEGYGWFSGVVTGVLPWRGPVIGFRSAAINDALLDGGDLLDVSMTQILGTAVSSPATAGILDVNVKNIDNDAASASGTVTFPNATLASTTNITAATGIVLSGVTHTGAVIPTVTTTTTATNVTTVNGLAAGVITATSIAADAITDAKVASDVTIASVTGAVGSVTGAVGSVTGAVGSVTGNVGGNVTGSVGSVVARVTANTDQINGTTQTAGDLIPAIESIGNVGGVAINEDAAVDNEAGGISGVTSGTTKVGTQTGTYTNTSFENQIYHIITHSANAIDRVYQFLLGGGTTVIGAKWVGYLTSANDTVTVSAWNHVGAAWEAIGSIAGSAGTTNYTYNLTLYPRHEGTSTAELGKVYIRLHCTGQTNPVLNTDQLVVSYAITSRSAGYANGAVWVDTTDGTAGTEPDVNGVADNPSLTFADAITIAGTKGLHKYEIANGSSITLAAAADNYTMIGHEWFLALGGQSISSTMVIDATVSGVSTGSSAEFLECEFNTITVGPCNAWNCLFKGTTTLASPGDYNFIDCASGIPGSTAPVLDMGAAVGATNLSFRKWSGGLTINNLASGDVVSVDVVSGGTITLNGADAIVNVRGMCTVVNNLTGSPTVNTSSVLNQTVLATPTNITAGTITTATNLTTNNDKTGYAIATGGIGSGATAAAEINNLADGFLDRNMATGSDSGTNSTSVRTPRQALRALRNKVSVAAGTATVTKEDDSTTSWTAAVATTAGDPISSVDPT